MTREMELLGVEEVETRVFLRDLGVIRPTQPLIRAVQDVTHGIPLFIEGIVPHLVQSGALYARRGGLSTRRGAVDTLGLPRHMVDAIAVRMQALPDASYPILSLAACLGGTFFAEELQSVGQADTVAMRDAIEAGLSHGILRHLTCLIYAIDVNPQK